MKRRNLPQMVFFILMLVSLLLFAIGIVLTRGQALINLLHQDDRDTFMDLFNNLSCPRNAYSLGASYPPAAILLYGVLAHSVPSHLRDAFNPSNHYVIRDSQAGLMLYVVLLIIFLLVFSFFFKKIVCGSCVQQEIALWCVLLSVPFLFSYERANLVLFSLIFTLIYIWGFDREEPWIRWLAFLSLSLAAAIKIYPAVLGLLLVRERRWKDTSILVCMGALVFMLPFLFFDGGISNVFAMIHNLTVASDIMATTSFGIKHDLSNFLNFLTYTTGIPFASFSTVLVVILMCSVCVVVVMHPRMPLWRAVTLLSSLMILVPGFSYTYTLLFMAPPLALFLRDAGKDPTYIRSDCLSAVFFAALFAPLVMPELVDVSGVMQRYYLTPVTLMENIALLVLVIGLLSREVLSTARQ